MVAVLNTEEPEHRCNLSIEVYSYHNQQQRQVITNTQRVSRNARNVKKVGEHLLLLNR